MSGPAQRATATVLFLAFLMVLFVQSSLASSDVATAFDAANKLYAEGKFIEAAEVYEGIIAGGQASAPLYFNLGSAWFKSGQLGRAIVAYRQAEQLSPRDPDLRANLQFARNQVQGPTVKANFWERRIGALSLNEWTWLGAVAVWLTFGLLTARQLKPALARSLKSWILATGASSVLLIACLAMAWTGQSARQTAIVTAPEATVRNGPFDESPSAFTARDGAELRVLDFKNDWLQVTDGTRHVGWIRRDTALLFPRS